MLNPLCPSGCLCAFPSACPLANVRYIFIYDKWLQLKLHSVQSMLLFLGQMALGDKMLSDTITISVTSKFEGLQNILVVHLDGHLTTPDGRPEDGWMDGRQTDKHTYIQTDKVDSKRYNPYYCGRYNGPESDINVAMVSSHQTF